MSAALIQSSRHPNKLQWEQGVKNPVQNPVDEEIKSNTKLTLYMPLHVQALIQKSNYFYSQIIILSL